MKFYLKYHKHEDEQYVRVNDIITLMQKLTIINDDSLDDCMNDMIKENDSEHGNYSIKKETDNIFMHATKIGKGASRRITGFTIKVLDNLYTAFNVGES